MYLAGVWRIYTSGTQSEIYTSEIYTSGTQSEIFTNGTQSEIYTKGTCMFGEVLCTKTQHNVDDTI